MRLRGSKFVRVALAASVLVAGLGGLFARPLTAAASCAVNVAGTCVVPGTDGTVPVPATDTLGVATSQVCPVPVAGQPTCTFLYELTVDAHNAFAQPMAPATATTTSTTTDTTTSGSTTGCAWPSNDTSTYPYMEVTWGIKAWNGGSSWDDGNNNWRLEFSGYSDYDDCGVTSVFWENSCNAYSGYYCDSATQGEFWDNSRHANTAWLNQNFHYHDFLGDGTTNQAQIRVWTTPEGHVTFGDYYQCTGNC